MHCWTSTVNSMNDHIYWWLYLCGFQNQVRYLTSILKGKRQSQGVESTGIWSYLPKSSKTNAIIRSIYPSKDHAKKS
jgi:hypothetical protein